MLSQLARCPTSQWVGFGKKREGHVKARPEGVHRGAGLGHHRLSQLEGLGAEGWVETEDQMVPSPNLDTRAASICDQFSSSVALRYVMG